MLCQLISCDYDNKSPTLFLDNHVVQNSLPVCTGKSAVERLLAPVGVYPMCVLHICTHVQSLRILRLCADLWHCHLPAANSRGCFDREKNTSPWSSGPCVCTQQRKSYKAQAIVSSYFITTLFQDEHHASNFAALIIIVFFNHIQPLKGRPCQNGDDLAKVFLNLNCSGFSRLVTKPTTWSSSCITLSMRSNMTWAAACTASDAKPPTAMW